MGTRFRPSAILCALGLALLWSGTVWAGAPVAVCGLSGTAGQSNCLIPNSDGSVNTTPQSGSSQDVVVQPGGAIGEVQASPTANTLLDRVKAIVTAITSATLTAGTAGTPSSQVLTMQGVTGMTPVQTTIKDISSGEYETVAASQTAQVLGATGAAGDYLLQVVCTPATTSPGVVTVLDNATSIVAFPGGASSVSNLLPFTVPVNAYSVSGAWKLTTGANVSCVGVGNFT